MRARIAGPATHPPSDRAVSSLTGCLVAGLALRLAAATRFPIVFDEVDVLAYGVARGLERGGLAFEVPLAVSNGITPLWFWLQAVPGWLFGATTRAGLRSLPIALGLLGIVLAHGVGTRLGGPRAGLIGGLLFATGGPFVYTNSLGQFSESLIAPLLLLVVLDLHPAEGPGRTLAPWRVTLWPAAMLLAYLGKGLLVFVAYALTLLASGVLEVRWGGADTRSTIGRALLLVAAPLVPALVWLLGAQAALFSGGGTLQTDFGTVNGVLDAIRKLTWGYGSEAKAFMVGTTADALWVFRDARSWPTLSLLAVPLVVTVGRLARDLARGLAAHDRLAARRALVPLGLALPIVAVLLAKGALDVRFHLLYIPVLLPYVAVTIDRWIETLDTGRRARFLGWGLMCLVYVAFSIPEGEGAARLWVIAIGTLALAAIVRVRQGGAGGATGLVVGGLLVAAVASGPLWWGTRWAWEPGPNETPRETATFPNVDVQLARRAIDREGLAVARTWLVRALERHPRDRTTLIEVGSALLRGGASDADVVARAAGDYARRHPADAEVRGLRDEALRRLSAR